MDISQRLKELRKQQNISQYKLAKLSNVSQSFISDIEAGKKTITIKFLKKLCTALNISLSDFFIEEKDTSQIPEDILVLMNKARSLTPEQRRIIIRFIIDFVSTVEDDD